MPSDPAAAAAVQVQADCPRPAAAAGPGPVTVTTDIMIIMARVPVIYVFSENVMHASSILGIGQGLGLGYPNLMMITKMFVHCLCTMMFSSYLFEFQINLFKCLILYLNHIYLNHTQPEWQIFVSGPGYLQVHQVPFRHRDRAVLRLCRRGLQDCQPESQCSSWPGSPSLRPRASSSSDPGCHSDGLLSVKFAAPPFTTAMRRSSVDRAPDEGCLRVVQTATAMRIPCQ